MRRKTALVSAFALSLTTLISGSALAYTVGVAGKIISVTINGSKSDDYNKFHGSVKIRPPGKNKRSVEYKWGGTNCPGKNLTADQVDILVGAFHERKSTHVVPHSKNGQGGAKCLVGFELKRPGGSSPTPS